MFDIVARKDFRHLFDEAFNWKDAPHYMVTDFKEKDGKCELDLHLAGFSKDDIKIELNDGYLHVSAEKKEEEKDEYSHRESFSSTSRSFYVGKDFTEEDFNAKFENGVLNISFDRKEPKQIEAKTINIK